MKSHNLNYSRKIYKQLSEMDVSKVDAESKLVLRLALHAAKHGQKFILPDGGRVHNDPSYRALDDSVVLRLPFPIIALEYPISDQWIKTGQFRSSRRVVFAMEAHEALTEDGRIEPLDEPQIMGIPAFWRDDQSKWMVMKPFFIAQMGFIERPDHGLPKVRVRISGSTIGNIESVIPNYQDEIHALMMFLNALQCINVSIEKQPGKRIKSKKQAQALPFDDYHVLVVSGRSYPGCGSGGGDHRSPREHLRRGHIRRLADGRKVWVNATVVCPGKGGVVRKDYLMEQCSAAMSA